MPIFQLPEECIFPDPRLAEPDGLLAIGGDYSTERLLTAYQHGIFPWFKENEEIFWFATNPRMVVFTKDYKISHGLKRELKKNKFTTTINKAFSKVIHACADTRTNDEEGTWINDEYIAAFIELHKLGYAYSFETWLDDKLVGGLYGIMAKKCFMGESMFHTESNASKIAFHTLMLYAIKNGLQFIDAQEETEHLRSLGGVLISFEEYYKLLRKAW